MITTVTLNPMLDKTVYLDSLKRGRIHRATKVDMTAGGKGINVARQLKQLGMKTLATGFLGGNVGSVVRGLLDSEGIDHEFVETGVVTREGMTYLESGGTQTAVFEPAGRVPVSRVQVLRKIIKDIVGKSTWVVCSGSSPCHETDDLYYKAILLAGKAGVKTALDSYGKAFKRGLLAIPTMIKPNRQEFQKTFGKGLHNEKEIRKAMDHWIHAGIEFVVITDGAKPAYAASHTGQWRVEAPSVKTVNPVGSGDAMVAGIVFGLEKNWEFKDCLRFGVAAGAANAQKWSVASSTYKEIESLSQKVSVQKLN